MKNRVLFLLLVILLTMIAINLQGQTVDPVQKGFDTSPDTVYGVLVGILVLFGVSAVGFFGWIFKKLFSWVEKYRTDRFEGDEKRTNVLESLLEETKHTNTKIDSLIEVQKGHGEKITHIDTKVEQIDGRVKGIEIDLEEVKKDVESLKPGKQ